MLDFHFDHPSEPFQPLRLSKNRRRLDSKSYLNAIVAEWVHRYRRVVPQIQQEIRAFANPDGSKPADPPTEKVLVAGPQPGIGPEEKKDPVPAGKRPVFSPKEIPIPEKDPLLVQGHNRLIEIEVTDEQFAKYFSGERRKKKIQRSAELIDAFLASDLAKPVTPQNPGESQAEPHPDAVASVQVPPEAVTETMAKLLVGQNRLAEAIEVYQQLQLRYPEKSSFFAVQIEKIKQG